jgi:hypothetical protein
MHPSPAYWATRCCNSFSPGSLFRRAGAHANAFIGRRTGRPMAFRSGGETSGRSPAGGDSREARSRASRASSNICQPGRHLAPDCAGVPARVEGNDFHGYSVQDFLEVDSRFGMRADLVELVRAAMPPASASSWTSSSTTPGSNWVYDAAETEARSSRSTSPPVQEPVPEERLRRRDHGSLAVARQPRLRLAERSAVRRDYTRAGSGSLRGGDFRDPRAEHKRTDFEVLRGVAAERAETLGRIFFYQYWIALTDCDGAAYRYAETCGRGGRAQVLQRR